MKIAKKGEANMVVEKLTYISTPASPQGGRTPALYILHQILGVFRNAANCANTGNVNLPGLRGNAILQATVTTKRSRGGLKGQDKLGLDFHSVLQQTFIISPYGNIPKLRYSSSLPPWRPLQVL